MVDVRTAEEFSSQHLPGAINVPVQGLRERLSELEPKDKAVVVYCKSGNRSGRAADILRRGGFGSVYDLGPMSAW